MNGITNANTQSTALWPWQQKVFIKPLIIFVAMISKTPKPPYYAVIFSSVKNEGENDYAEMGNRMLDLAQKQEGFLGAESARNELGITVSYWENIDAIKSWKGNLEHLEAQKRGKSEYYKAYKVRIAKVEHDYGF